jgi:putative transposase
LWRLRYKLSFRDLAEIFLTAGFIFSHEAVREWEEKLAPLISDELKSERKGKAGNRWRADETLLKIKGELHYLNRAIVTDGKLVDVKLSKVRDLQTTEACFKQAVETVGHKPIQITTDKEVSYPKAINKVLGGNVEHRTICYLNNKMEQNHRGIKARDKPMLGFKSVESAGRFSQAYEEQRELFRFRRYHKHKVSLPLRQVPILGKFEELKEKFKKWYEIGWILSIMAEEKPVTANLPFYTRQSHFAEL